MHVAVLCGGKGTRLGEPIKCLTEVAGRPWMDWKLEQLERCGATDITLMVGPYAEEFARYGLRMIEDPQKGIGRALRGLGLSVGWWTMGDVLLEQPLSWPVGPVVYVRPGEQIGGLWLDCGLYYGTGGWRMKETRAIPYHINTQADREEADAYLRGLSIAR